jgi:hypothetical protein
LTCREILEFGTITGALRHVDGKVGMLTPMVD